MDLLKRYLRPYTGRMIFGLCIKIIGTVMDLFLPWILSHIIDEVIPRREIQEIFTWGAVMVMVSIIAISFNIWANRMASAVSCQCTQRVRHDLYRKISYLDAAQVDRFSISSLELRLTGDTYNLNQMTAMAQRMGVRGPILLLGGITLTFLLDRWLTLVMVCTLPFIGITVFYISKKSIPLYGKLQQSLDEMNRVVRENTSGVRIIKALGKSEYEKKRFEQVNQEAIDWEKKAGTTMAASNPLITLFLNIGLIGVVLIGAHLVDHGISTNGKIIAFMSYFTIISNALLSVSRMFTIISKGMASVKRIETVLEEEPTLWVEKGKDSSVERREAFPQIVFEHVNFSFGGIQVLKDITFSLEKGETLGIIGATGSGKSTLLALLLRIYQPDSGQIYIDGVKIGEIPTEDLRKKFGVVFQNDFLFADTIRENVNFGRELSDEAIALALADAQAAEFVSAYEEKEAYRLDMKGANLSGGQKQRVLLARALAANPEILILDDASSALDYKTDSIIRKTLMEKYQNVTTLLVAQRISSIAHADLILVLDHGTVIGAGKHEELLSDCGQYAEIAQHQMGGGVSFE